MHTIFTKLKRSLSHRRVQLGIETLEERQLMAVTSLAGVVQTAPALTQTQVLQPTMNVYGPSVPVLTPAGLSGGAGGLKPLDGLAGQIAPAATDANGYYVGSPQGLMLEGIKWDVNSAAGSTGFSAPVDLSGMATSMLAASGDRIVLQDGNLNLYLQHKLDDAWNNSGDPKQLSPHDQIVQLTQTKAAKTLKDKIGMNLYGGNIFVPTTGELDAKITGTNSFALRYVVKNVRFDFRVQIPDDYRKAAAHAAGAAAAAPLVYGFPWLAAGVYAAAYAGVMSILDPKFSVTFDVELDATIKFASALNAVGGNVTVVGAAAQVARASMQSENAIGNIVSAVDSLLRSQGGTGIFQPAMQALNDADTTNGNPNKWKDTFANQLSGMDRALADTTKLGYAELKVRLDPTMAPAGKLILTLKEAVPIDSLSVHIDRIQEHLGGSTAQQAAVKTFVLVKLDGAYISAQDAGLYNNGGKDIPPNYFNKFTLEQTRLAQGGLSYGRDFERRGLHTITLEVWRVVTGANGPPGVSSGMVRSFDLAYDFRTGKISGAVKGVAGQQFHISSSGPYAGLGVGAVPEIWFTINLGKQGLFPSKLPALPYTWSPLHEGVIEKAVPSLPIEPLVKVAQYQLATEPVVLAGPVNKATLAPVSPAPVVIATKTAVSPTALGVAKAATAVAAPATSVVSPAASAAAFVNWQPARFGAFAGL